MMIDPHWSQENGPLLCGTRDSRSRPAITVVSWKPPVAKREPPRTFVIARLLAAAIEEQLAAMLPHLADQGRGRRQTEPAL
jgi:hypothetical protein